MLCLQPQNLKSCPCTYLPAACLPARQGEAGPDCPRKGICCECLRHHLANKELPACCFSPATEKTYDRSIGKFIEDRGKLGLP